MMDDRTAQCVARATRDFYDSLSEPFSRTRSTPWQGWEKMADLTEPLSKKADVLDLACGNLRFSEFLRERHPDIDFRIWSVDNCEKLADSRKIGPKDLFINLDILKELESGRLLERLDATCPKCSLTVSFGFMHHIPKLDWRKELIRTMVLMTRPLGYICISFWQISNAERILQKAKEVTPIGNERLGVSLSMEEGDYFLDWNGDDSSIRYVHECDDDEIAELVSEAKKEGASLFSAYSADGRTNDLNRYVILRKDIC